jgi:hypothetical protein
LTRRRTAAALVSAVLLAAATAAVAAVPKAGTFEGSTGQGLNASVKVNAHHRIKRFRIYWWAPCDRPNATWGSPDNPGGTVDRDLKDDPIKQAADGSFSDSEKYSDVETNGGEQSHFRMTMNGQFTDATHAHGKFTIKIRVTHFGETYDHCRKTVKWHVGD